MNVENSCDYLRLPLFWLHEALMKGFIIAGTGQCFQLQLLPFHIKATLFSQKAGVLLGPAHLAGLWAPSCFHWHGFWRGCAVKQSKEPCRGPRSPFPRAFWRTWAISLAQCGSLALPQLHLEATAKELWDLLEGLLALLSGAAAWTPHLLAASKSSCN